MRLGFSETMDEIRVLFRLVEDVVMTEDERWAILHGITALIDLYNMTRDPKSDEPYIVVTTLGEERYSNG